MKDDSKSTIPGPTPPKLTEEELVEQFRRIIWDYKDNIGWNPIFDQAYTQIRDIIREHFKYLKDKNFVMVELEKAGMVEQQKPRVGRGWIDDLCMSISMNPPMNLRGLILEKLKEIGVGVIEE